MMGTAAERGCRPLILLFITTRQSLQKGASTYIVSQRLERPQASPSSTFADISFFAEQVRRTTDMLAVVGRYCPSLKLVGKGTLCGNITTLERLTFLRQGFGDEPSPACAEVRLPASDSLLWTEPTPTTLPSILKLLAPFGYA